VTAALIWDEAEGAEPARLYVHGLGATADVFRAAAAHPALAGRRSLFADLMGHGRSPRPADFPYTPEAHADALAAVLAEAGVTRTEVVAHSLGGAVAVLLAARHPAAVGRLVLVDPLIDPPTSGGTYDITSYEEAEFVATGWAEVRQRAGERWWATMRLADRTALHRTAAHVVRGTRPPVRRQLGALRLPRTLIRPAAHRPPGDVELAAAGVAVVPVPDCGHNVMRDNPDGFARAVTGGGAEAEAEAGG
jgi:pimeloyl-ACP methyl ester carboxylesterase